MRVKIAGESDKELWDGYVASHECGHFMQSSAWGTLRRALGWEIRPLMALEGDRPVAAMLLQFKRLPLLPLKLGLSQRGPVFDAGRPESLRLLLMAARGIKGLGLLRCDPYFASADARCAALRTCGFTPLGRTWSHWNNPRHVMTLNISQGPEEYLKTMPTAFRTKIRKPEKHGVSFRTGAREDLPAFCALMLETARNKNIAAHNDEYYATLYEHLSEAGMLAFFVAEYEGKVISVGMSVKYGRKAWLIYAASATEYFRLGANRALQMRMLEWAMEAGCDVYDFRGSATNFPPRKSDPGYGVYEFKKSFGAELKVLSPYHDFSPTPLAKILPALIDGLAVPVLYTGSRLISGAKSSFYGLCGKNLSA